jgi:hypothetical protein
MMKKIYKGKEMSNSNQQTGTQLTMFHGVLGLILSIFGIISGFSLGVKFFPLGGVAVASCIFGGIQMIQRKHPTPGIATFFISTMVMVVGLTLKDYLP